MNNLIKSMVLPLFVLKNIEVSIQDNYLFKVKSRGIRTASKPSSV